MRICVIPALLVLLLGGCAPNRGRDLLESRLRQQDEQLAELETELRRTREELRIASQDAAQLRAQLDEAGSPFIATETAHAALRTVGIELSRLFTGPLDQDGQPGDEMFSAVVVPLDADGSLVKTPGKVEIEALDLSRPEGERRLGRWSFDEEQAREAWHEGVFGTGYRFRLPWQRPPSSEEVLVHAKLTTPDGRQFDATRKFKVTVPAGGIAEPPRVLPMAAEGELPRILPRR